LLVLYSCWSRTSSELIRCTAATSTSAQHVVVFAAAATAGKLGAKVLLIEKNRLGGDCTWSGCVPSKALIHCAREAKILRDAAAGSSFSSVSGSVSIDMAKVRQKVLGVVQEIYEEETPEVFAGKGVDVVLGTAEFVDAHTVRVQPKAGGAARTITASSFVVATGAVPRVPQGVQGIDDVPYFTYESIFHNARLPRKLVVLGGGPIGCELAQAYAFLGADVTIVARNLLGKETRNAREVMEVVFRECGMTHAAARPASITCTHNAQWLPTAAAAGASAGDSASPHDANVTTPAEAFGFNRVEPEYTVTLKDGTVLTADMLLVSVGRTPIVAPLNLPAAGVQLTYGEAGSDGKKPITAVPVDSGLRTNIKHIYVTGDANGGPQFTHLAGKQGFVGARNSLFPGSFPGHTNAMPRATFTTPEVSSVGLTLEEAEAAHGSDLRVSRRDNKHIDRSLCDDDRHGFVEMYCKRDGSVVGATCVGSRAGEQIGLFIAAMTHGLKAADLAGVMTAYPTHLIGVQQVASSAASELFLETKLGKFVNGLYGKGPHPGAQPGTGHVQGGRFMVPASASPAQSGPQTTGAIPEAGAAASESKK